MVTYKTTSYETAEELREAINSELSKLEYPYQVKHRLNGLGQLVSVKAPLYGGSLYLMVDFDTVGSKTLALDALMSYRLLEMPEALLDILLEAQTAFKEDYETRAQAKRDAKRLEFEQAMTAEKKAEADKKAEAKYQATKAKAIKAFEALTESVSPKSTADEFYYSLGWLAKHVGSVSARLPDYLSEAFTRHFGQDAVHTSVDSRKKTVNGNSMQWTFGFTATLRKPENIPATITTHLGATGKQIADTSFIWDLVDNYGFKFGKTQDLDKIRSCVPASFIPSFEAGLA